MHICAKAVKNPVFLHWLGNGMSAQALTEIKPYSLHQHSVSIANNFIFHWEMLT